MSKKKINNVDILDTEKVLTGKQDWEIDTPKMTEKEKKKWYQNHIEQTQAGSSNMRKPRKFIFNFKQTQEDIDRSKYQDYLGNPLPGYKWGESGKIVIDIDYREKNQFETNGQIRSFTIIKSENFFI